MMLFMYMKAYKEIKTLTFEYEYIRNDNIILCKVIHFIMIWIYHCALDCNIWYDMLFDINFHLTSFAKLFDELVKSVCRMTTSVMLSYHITTVVYVFLDINQATWRKWRHILYYTSVIETICDGCINLNTRPVMLC